MPESTPFRVEATDTGTRLTVMSAWCQSIEAYVLENDIRDIYLNYRLGWRGDNLQFLHRLPRLESFWLLDRDIRDIDGVHALQRLRSLKLEVDCDAPIYFDAFPQLEEFAGNWRGGMGSLFDSVRLLRLRLDRYRGVSSAPFARLENLQFLALYSARLHELEGIGSLSCLRSLSLAYCRRLTSLRGIERLTELEELLLEACKGLGEISQVSYLTHLRTLVLNNLERIESIKPIECLRNLETLQLLDSTNIVDGDLSPLSKLPTLRSVGFVARKHYAPKWTTFPRQWFERSYNLLWG